MVMSDHDPELKRKKGEEKYVGGEKKSKWG
jgi:hypothetical protein